MGSPGARVGSACMNVCDMVCDMKGIGHCGRGGEEGNVEGPAFGIAIGRCGLTVGFVGRGGILRSELVKPGICSATTFPIEARFLGIV